MTGCRRSVSSPEKPEPVNYVIEYADALERGDIVAGRRVRRWYARMADRVRAGKYKRWHWDLERANKPLEFIALFCRRSDGKHMGEPIVLDIWQKAFVQLLFGWVDDAGNRQFLEALLLVARKNGKTTLLACIALYMLAGDREGSPEIYFVATKLDQARLGYNATCRMLAQSKTLSKHLKKRKTDIYFAAVFGYIMPICSDSDGLDGLNSHCVVIDELHAIKDVNLYEVLKQSTSARDQPLVVMITTAGTVRESIFDQIYDHARQVCDGVIEDDSFCPIMYELDSPDEWTREDCWIKANPGLGTIKGLAYLRGMVQRAQTDHSRRRGIMCKDFNILGTEADAWLPFELINNTDKIDPQEIADCYAIGGVDLSATTDLTAATLLVRKPDGRTYVLQQYFIPEDIAARKIAEDRVPYDIWRDQGWVTYCPGSRVDYHAVTAWFVRLRETRGLYPLCVGYDPWSSSYWVAEMQAEGFSMETVRQGAQTMSAPMKTMRADMEERRLIFDNNPVLKWCLSNLRIKTDENENIRPVKGKNPKQRIDGAVSLIDAYVCLDRHLVDYGNLME